MINKNDYRKINDKKILHKSGKTWKVVSLALLLAIGGGATVAATNANANADATDNAYNDAPGVTSNVAEQAQQLENNNYYGGSAKASVAPKSASKETKAPSFNNISYAPSEYYEGNNASAASYKNNEAFDKAEMDYYGPIVSGYVEQVNAKYPEARSLANSYNDLKGKTANEQSTANSYSATYANSNTANVISAKASAAGQTTSYYTDSVAYQVLGNGNDNGYINDVRNDDILASEESAVASGASLVSAINNSRVLSTEYRDQWTLDAASASADSAYAKDEAEVASDIASNSDMNQSDLASATSEFNSLSINARVANINSNIDADAVKSIASSAGFSFGSSTVSSAISLLASVDYAQSGSSANDYVNTNNNSSLNDLNSYQTNLDTSTLTFSATNQNNSGSSSAVIGVGNGNDSATLSNAMSVNANDSANAGKSSAYASASTANDLLRVVSDTAAQQQYAKYANSLQSEMSKDQASVSAYTLEVSSAQSAANSAATEASDAESVAASAKYLAGNGQDQDSVKLSNIFGTTSTVTSNVPKGVDLSTYFNNVLTSAGKASVASDTDTAGKGSLNYGFVISDIIGAYSTAATHENVTSSNASWAQSMMAKASNEANSVYSNVYNIASGLNTTASSSDISGANTNDNFVAAASSAISKGNYGHTTEDVLNAINNDINKIDGGSLGNDQFFNIIKSASASFSAVGSVIASAANSNSVTNGSTTSQVTSYVAGLFDASSNDASNYASASSALTKYIGLSNASAVSDIASAANSAASNYKSEYSASASYAKATDQDVTISSQFASYYNSLASNDAAATNTAKQSLDNFLDAHAATGYASASDAYAKASANEPNDRDFAYAYGKNVLLNSPEYITVTKNAMLHSDTQYAKSNSVESVKAGTQFAVKGIGFDMAGNVRFVVADKNGKNLYLTANNQYFVPTYLAPSVDYNVTLTKDTVAHSTLGFVKDAQGTIPANTQLEGYTVPTSTNHGRRDAAFGVTRLQVKGGKFNGDYITTNCKYLTNVSENNSDNSNANAEQNANPVQHTINFAD